ncbi:MAG: hypothetical protein ABSB28_05930 [Candidatus Bathyarchaeia archaeon]
MLASSSLEKPAPVFCPTIPKVMAENMNNTKASIIGISVNSDAFKGIAKLIDIQEGGWK